MIASRSPPMVIWYASRAKRFRRISGHRDLWLLVRALDRHTKELASSRIAA